MNLRYHVWQKLTTPWAEGRSSCHKNVRFIGSLNIISAISTTRYSYSTLLTETNRSIIFIQFLKQLMKYIKQREGIWAHEILIVMDNSQCTSKGCYRVPRVLKGEVSVFTPVFTRARPSRTLLWHLQAKNS